MSERSTNLLGLAVLVGAFTWIVAANQPIDTFEDALNKLNTTLVPAISVANPPEVMDTSTTQDPTTLPLPERLPAIDTFPTYGADPSEIKNDTLLLEIVSSTEKADGQRADRRWLVDVANRFNQRQERTANGQRIQIMVRTIPSGMAAQLLMAGKLHPAGYTPASHQWLELLHRQGMTTTTINNHLVGNASVIAIKQSAYKTLDNNHSTSFSQVIDHTLSGKIKMGYCNPYICSPGLDFLHTLLWMSAGHYRDHQPLSVSDIAKTKVNTSFQLFQKNIITTTPTYIEMIEIWKRKPESFDAVVMGHQSFLRLKQEPGFEDLVAVPFGSPQTSPLAALPWTTAAQQDALRRFASFAVSAPMQALARQFDYGTGTPVPQQARPPKANGELLSQEQQQWKQRKDNGHTVYLQLLIDTSGSMAEHERLKKLKQAIALSVNTINAGNQVGLISFSDQPVRQLPLQPFDRNTKHRLLAAVQQLRPEGGTALYDGLAVALADLMKARQADPKGRFYLLLLTDGKRTMGLELNELSDIVTQSGVRIIPISYGDVNENELIELASIRESTLYQGSPEKIQLLMNDLFQTNL
jgi:Ca-activated chloride channel family protein